ncbi:macrophage mannose receptor 1-like [Strongylocentrotus purpuratus]|uniref:C-type lectin domain-containing protein n=1 Tax=Strongylocentrotus purpuratus TaxID=7668 RepID=A0A7M7NGS3_STRPU|nr:macrophage mannose receptor 1-like [Strongylocentrotus purpuratus]
MTRLNILALSLFAFISVSTAYVTCPDDWTRHGFSCYYFRSCDVTWDDGERECLALGGHLVSIDTRAEMAFVENLVAGEKGPFWIGLNDKYREGQWFFTDMRRLRPELGPLWGAHEPNNNGDEDCVMFPHGADKKWNDAKCDSKYSFICEIEKFGCPDGWGEYGDSCYHQVVTPKVNQFDAQTHCQSIHQDCSLVKIDNHDEQAFLESFFGESCADWIGLLGEVNANANSNANGVSASHHHDHDDANGGNDGGNSGGSGEFLTRDYFFTDGQPMVHDFWKSNEPNFDKDNDRVCAIQKNTLGWNDYGCGNEMSYICELKKPSF